MSVDLGYIHIPQKLNKFDIFWLFLVCVRIFSPFSPPSQCWLRIYRYPTGKCHISCMPALFITLNNISFSFCFCFLPQNMYLFQTYRLISCCNYFCLKSIIYTKTSHLFQKFTWNKCSSKSFLVFGGSEVCANHLWEIKSYEIMWNLGSPFSRKLLYCERNFGLWRVTVCN